MDFDGVVILSPEYSVDVPLWPNSQAVVALVPAPLLEKLVAWQADFDSNFGWQDGWHSEEARDRWAEVATVLESELRIVLAGKAELIVDLWPINNSDHNRPLQEYSPLSDESLSLRENDDHRDS
jgi:hypothetical protein